MAERRKEAIQLLQAGDLKQVQIARHLGVTEAAVSKWRKKLEEEGPDSLELHKATGRPPKLGEKDIQILRKKLEYDLDEDGLPSELWYLDKVNELIKKDFHVSFNKNYVYELLNRKNLKISRKNGMGVTKAIHFRFNKRLLRIKYKNKFNRIEKDISIYFNLSMLDEIWQVIADFHKPRSNSNNHIFQGVPGWWPKFLNQNRKDFFLVDNTKSEVTIVGNTISVKQKNRSNPTNRSYKHKKT